MQQQQPSMLSVGVDIMEIDRIAASIERFGARFLNRVYTAAEQQFCRGRVPELAVRFAGKEAVMKCLGTGVRGVAWREIEILPMRGGKPLVYLHGRAARRAEVLHFKEVGISLSHSKVYAVAMVVAGVG